MSDAMRVRRPFHPYACALLLLSACSSGSQLNTTVDEPSQGAVSLTQVSDRSFQAAHPIKIDQTLIAQVLNGMLIRDDEGTSRRLFSGSEVASLAPRISESLRRAAPDEQVSFSTGRSADPDSTAQVGGVLYAYGRSLYVTMTRYPTRPRTATASTGATTRILSFIPEAAKRDDSFLDSRAVGNALVIDYELLAKLPPASLPPDSAPSASTKAPQPVNNGTQQDPSNRDAEIQALRKELQEIKKQLAEQEAERTRAPRTNPAK